MYYTTCVSESDKAASNYVEKPKTLCIVSPLMTMFIACVKTNNIINIMNIPAETCPNSLDSCQYPESRALQNPRVNGLYEYSKFFSLSSLSVMVQIVSIHISF